MKDAYELVHSQQTPQVSFKPAYIKLLENRSDLTIPADNFSDNEIVALLSGVLKHGENNWAAILKDYDFPKERKINCLA